MAHLTHHYRGSTILPTASCNARGRWYIAQFAGKENELILAEEICRQYETLARAKAAIDADHIAREVDQLRAARDGA